MTALCILCARHEPRVALCCYRCRDNVSDLVSPSNTGSRYNPTRPDDPVVWPSVPALLDLVHQADAQRAGTGIAGGGSGVFRSTSPADDHVIALRDPRTRPDEDFAALVGMRWLGHEPDDLCAAPDVAVAVRELRALQVHLLGVTGNGLARSVGDCFQLVDPDGHRLDDRAVEAAFAAAALPRGVHGPTPWPPTLWRCSTALYMPVLAPRAEDEPIRDLPTLRCAGCGYPYRGAELVQLGRDQEEAA